MIKTGGDEARCVFAGDSVVKKVMVNHKEVYPPTPGYIVFPDVPTTGNNLFIITFRVNQHRTNWVVSDFLNNISNNHIWLRYPHPDPYMISFYRTANLVSKCSTKVGKYYIEGIYLQSCADLADLSNLGFFLPNLRIIVIGKGIRRIRTLHALGYQSSNLKYVFLSLKSTISSWTLMDYVCGDTPIDYLQAIDTHKVRSHVLTNTGNTRYRPSSDELRWLIAPWGNRHEMSNLTREDECNKIGEGELAKYKKFSQFRYVPIRLVASDATNRLYHTVCQLGLFDENGINFARQTGNVYTSSTNNIHVGTRAFDGNWSTFWHCSAPLGGTYLDKRFNTRHQLDFIRIKGRSSNVVRNVTYFWMLGRNSISEEWEHIASIDNSPNYLETWGADEQRGWPLSEFQSLFSRLEVIANGTRIRFGVGRVGTVDLAKASTITPDRIFTLRVNGADMGIKLDSVQLIVPGANTDLYFNIDGIIKAGDKVELDHDGTHKALYVVDTRVRGKAGYGSHIYLPTSNNMSVQNKSTQH